MWFLYNRHSPWFICKNFSVKRRELSPQFDWVGLQSSAVSASQPVQGIALLNVNKEETGRHQITCHFLKITKKNSAVITIQWIVVKIGNSYLLYKWEKCCVHCVRFQECCQNEKKMICEELAGIILLSVCGRAESGVGWCWLMLLITGVCEAAGADLPHNLRTTRDKNCHCKKQGLVTQSWHQERSITSHHLILISPNTPRTGDL